MFSILEACWPVRRAFLSCRWRKERKLETRTERSEFRVEEPQLSGNPQIGRSHQVRLLRYARSMIVVLMLWRNVELPAGTEMSPSPGSEPAAIRRISATTSSLITIAAAACLGTLRMSEQTMAIARSFGRRPIMK